MRFSRSTQLLIYIRKYWLINSVGTDRTGELQYNLCISNDITQMVNFPTRIPYCDSHSPALLDFFLSSDTNICTAIVFPLLVVDHVMIIWELFQGRISLNSALLVLLENFVSGFRLELMYILLIESIRSNLTHFHGFQLFMLLP